jgi:hypothetical protein
MIRRLVGSANALKTSFIAPPDVSSPAAADYLEGRLILPDDGRAVKVAKRAVSPGK